MATVERNHNWVTREYNDEKWHSVLQLLIEQNKSGCDLSTLINRFRIHLNELQIPGSTFLNSEKEQKIAKLMNPVEFISLREKITLPYLIALETYDLGSAELLKLFCPDDADAVVELGSGFGLRLADFWLKGGPQNLRYYAFEYTDNGRKCADLLSSFERNFKLTSHPFNYHIPDLSPIASQYEHVYFITHSSIEQIPKIQKELLEMMVSVSKKITVTHLEPIGWQIQQKDDAAFRYGTSKEYAQTNDYNQNYWSLLNGFLDEKNLKIKTVHKDILGLGRENAVSLISWNT